MILSPEFLSFCEEHEDDNIYELSLQHKNNHNIDIQSAIQQIKGRQIAKHKLPSWYAVENITYPIHLSLEQASSEKTAHYKQSLVTGGETMIDLTGGLGVDISFLSAKYNKAIYVEQQEELTTLAKHNFQALGLHNIDVINSDSNEYLRELNSQVDLIYIDPARRDNSGHKIVMIEDCVPNLLEIQNELRSKAKRVMIKLSPMLDISLALSKLGCISFVHIVSVDNECKELLFLMEKDKVTSDVQFHCVNIGKQQTDSFSYMQKEEVQATSNFTSDLGIYLYEPNASVMKSGAFKLIGQRFGLKKLQINSHLYTSNIMEEGFPGRKFKINRVSSFGKKELKQALNEIDKANISVRNFPMSVEALRKKLKVAEGGTDYIFATTLEDNQKVLIICERL